MKFNNTIKEDSFLDPLDKYHELGGGTLNYRQLGDLVLHKKISPYAIVKKEKEFKQKMKKSKKEIAKAIIDYYESRKKNN